MRRWTILACLAAALALVAGCDDFGAADPRGVDEPDPAVTLDPDRTLSLQFEDPRTCSPSDATLESGEITVVLQNNTADVEARVELEGLELTAPAGQREVATIELQPGTYTYVCDVSPRATTAGMEGTLTVTE